MKCPNCDQEIEASAAFCGNCGHRLEASAESDQPATPAEADSAAAAAMSPESGQPAAAASDAAATPATPDAPTVEHEQAANVNAAAQSGGAPTAQDIPAYAVGQEQSKSAKRLTLAVVLAALSIPGAVIPIIGFGLAVTALVIASNHKRAGKGKMITAAVLASVGLLLSILAFNYNLNEYNKRKQTGYNGSFTASVSAADSRFRSL